METGDQLLLLADLPAVRKRALVREKKIVAPAGVNPVARVRVRAVAGEPHGAGVRVRVQPLGTNHRPLEPRAGLMKVVIYFCCVWLCTDRVTGGERLVVAS